MLTRTRICNYLTTGLRVEALVAVALIAALILLTLLVPGCAAFEGFVRDMAPVAEEAVGDAVGAAAAEAANQGLRAAQGEEADWSLVLGAGLTALAASVGAGVLGVKAKRKRAKAARG